MLAVMAGCAILRGVKLLLSHVCVLGVLLGACREKGEAFLGITELCPRRAEQICSALESCCEGGEGTSCVKRETDACEALRKQIGNETGLQYQSEHASDVTNEQAAALDNCEAPYPVQRYFKNTRADGETCDRDTQCESGLCGSDSEVCERAEEASLCPVE
jgi:hypothetical protein